MKIQIDMGAYKIALDKFVRGIEDYRSKTRRDALPLEDLAEEVAGVTSDPALVQLAREGTPQALDKLYFQLVGMSSTYLEQDEPDYDRWGEIRGVSELVFDASVALEEGGGQAEDIRGYAETLLSETKQNAKRAVVILQGAVRRVKNWTGSPVVVIPQEGLDADGMFSASSNMEVLLGKQGLGFTLFLSEDGSVRLDDLLEGGDTDFFKDLSETADYFNLVQELRQPGSSSRGKRVVLWTARPVKDRHIYEGARTVPPNLFLTTDPDRAYGLASDLGGLQTRDLWRIVMNTKDLVVTLDRGRLKDYQIVGIKPVPVESIALYDEGGVLHSASRARKLAVAWLKGAL